MRIAVSDAIYLDEFQPSDQAACVEYLNEREIYERTLRIPFPYTEAHFTEWYEIVTREKERQGRPVHWVIRGADGRLMGCIGFEGLEQGKGYRAEIGYWLAKPFWGRGIMTAVVRRACEYGFAEYGLGKIVAHVFAGNRASARVLEKCGFSQEGYLRQHYLKDGRPIDALLFALLRPTPYYPGTKDSLTSPQH